MLHFIVFSLITVNLPAHIVHLRVGFVCVLILPAKILASLKSPLPFSALLLRKLAIFSLIFSLLVLSTWWLVAHTAVFNTLHNHPLRPTYYCWCEVGAKGVLESLVETSWACLREGIITLVFGLESRLMLFLQTIQLCLLLLHDLWQLELQL